MKCKDINQKFTDKVAEYMSKGLHINVGTMAGHQGEIAKIDLTDGKEVYRILLDSKSNFEGPDEVHLIVAKSGDKVPADSFRDYYTIWNDRLEIIEEEIFYEMGTCHTTGEKFYGSKEEAEAAFARRIEHWRNRESTGWQYEDITEKAIEIAIPKIKKDLGLQRINRSYIVVKKGHYRDEKSYSIAYGSKYRVELA